MHFHSVWMSFPTFCLSLNIHYWYFKITFDCFLQQTIIFYWRHARNLTMIASVSSAALLERSTLKKHTWQFQILTSNIPTNHYVSKAAQVRNGAFLNILLHHVITWHRHATSKYDINIIQYYNHAFVKVLYEWKFFIIENSKMNLWGNLWYMSVVLFRGFQSLMLSKF